MLKALGGFAGGAAVGAVNYKGTWNASTNSPALSSGTGNKGDYYVVSTAGNTDLDGITDWSIGDWAIFNGTVWQKVDNTDAVSSVNGQVGTVVLDAADVNAVADSVFVNVTGLLTGGGQLTGNVAIDLANIPVANVTGAVVNTTEVIAGTGLGGGGNLEANVTVFLANTAVSPDSYGGANTVATFTVDQQGRLTAAGNTTIAITTAEVSGLGTIATQDANNVNITGGTVVVSEVTAANVTVTANLYANLTTSSTATFATSSLPLVPEGYIEIELNGATKKIPYYGV